jgi:hypothetical protein
MKASSVGACSEVWAASQRRCARFHVVMPGYTRPCSSNSLPTRWRARPRSRRTCSRGRARCRMTGPGASDPSFKAQGAAPSHGGPPLRPGERGSGWERRDRRPMDSSRDRHERLRMLVVENRRRRHRPKRLRELAAATGVKPSPDDFLVLPATQQLWRAVRDRPRHRLVWHRICGDRLSGEVAKTLRDMADRLEGSRPTSFGPTRPKLCWCGCLRCFGIPQRTCRLRATSRWPPGMRRRDSSSRGTTWRTPTSTPWSHGASSPLT